MSDKSEIAPGIERTFRIYVPVSKNDKLKTLTINQAAGYRSLVVDASTAQ